MFDDLGFEVPLARPPRRVVSLVPSLTEAIAVTLPGRLVGATTWCIAPAGLDDGRRFAACAVMRSRYGLCAHMRASV